MALKYRLRLLTAATVAAVCALPYGAKTALAAQVSV